MLQIIASPSALQLSHFAWARVLHVTNDTPATSAGDDDDSQAK